MFEGTIKVILPNRWSLQWRHAPPPGSYIQLFWQVKLFVSVDTLYRIRYSTAMAVYTTQEAGMMLGISERRVRKLLEEGRIRGKKMGRDWVVLDLTYTKKRKQKEKNNNED